jgi:hypothetical protein
MENQEILDRTGLDKWEDLVHWLEGYTLAEIIEEFNKCWPHDENEALAQVVFDKL